MVEGLAAFQRRWGAIPERVAMEVRNAMEEIAEEIVAQMYQVAPHVTGDLAGSIGWTWGDAPKGSLTLGAVAGNEYATLRITIYAGGGKAFYARFQEFGTVNMPANPFFFPVWRAKRKSVRNRITRAMNKAIKAI
jgi:HK97 gp10 family phage protein